MTAESNPPTVDLAPSDHPNWARARPAIIPGPTYWPAGTAFGIALLFWGILTSLVVVGAGGVVLGVSLVGWIGEMRHESEE